MPAIPIGTVVESGTSLANGLIQTIGGIFTNKSNRKAAKQAYATQRQDALTDRDYENSYNSPLAQMTRFKEAGLNPHLIYGQGNEGASVRSTNMEVPKAENAAAGAGAGIAGAGRAVSNMYNLQAIQAQTDNLKAQNDVLQQDRELRAAQVVQQKLMNLVTGVKFNADTLDYGMKSENRQISLDAQKVALQKTIADMESTFDNNKRAAELHPGNLRQQILTAAQTAASTAVNQAQRNNILQNTENLQKEGTLKQLEINLRQIGVNPNDPQWQRIIGQLLSKVLPGNPADAIADGIKKIKGSK